MNETFFLMTRNHKLFILCAIYVCLNETLCRIGLHDFKHFFFLLVALKVNMKMSREKRLMAIEFYKAFPLLSEKVILVLFVSNFVFHVRCFKDFCSAQYVIVC